MLLLSRATTKILLSSSSTKEITARTSGRSVLSTTASSAVLMFLQQSERNLSSSAEDHLSGEISKLMNVAAQENYFNFENYFRYSGRTQKQMQEHVRENFVKRQSFQR